MSLLNLLGGLFRRAPAPAPRPPEPVNETAPAVTPAPASPPLSPADRDALVRTLYGEVRGEPEAGQVAVVHVVRNRVLRARTGAAFECHRPWQFSCWNGNDPNLPKLLTLQPTAPAYLALGTVVDRAWTAPDAVQGARHYYVTDMPKPPAWAVPPAREVARIGAHSFWAGVA